MLSKQLNKILQDIKSIKIQGATAIAEISLRALVDYAQEIKHLPAKNFNKKIISIGKKLAYARPNEPLLQNAVFLLNQQLSLLNFYQGVNYYQHVKETLKFYQELIDVNNQKIISSGYRLVKKNDNILTHCHSSTVEKIFKTAKQKKINFSVFADETRPLYQGRITARNLAKAGISVTQVADSASGFLISSYSGKDLIMDKIIIGADVININGSILNKIGSYDIAASAKHNKIPVYVAVNLLKFKNTDQFDIEQRSADEVWQDRPRKVKVINYAFDVVPAKFITGLITEFGIIKPNAAKRYVKKYYPWIK